MRGAGALAGILVAGCGASAPAPAASAPAASPPRVERSVVSADEERAALVARAEKALVDDLVLDYERPFVKKANERPETVAKLREACEAGHPQSCWRAATIAPRAEQPALHDLVAANCRKGDHMSCRALLDANAPGAPTYPDLPGALGRSLCQGADDCDLVGLQRECNDGFAWSCYAVATHTRNGADAAAAKKRLAGLVVENCSADIVLFCSGMVELAPAEQTRMDERMCALQRTCGPLASAYDERGLATKARDALERSCQFTSSPKWCADLGAAYLDKKYEEPVPGRGQQLVDDSCKKLGPYGAKLPACKRANK